MAPLIIKQITFNILRFLYEYIFSLYKGHDDVIQFDLPFGIALTLIEQLFKGLDVELFLVELIEGFLYLVGVQVVERRVADGEKGGLEELLWEE